MFNKRLYKRVLCLGVPVMLLSLSIFSGIACDADTATPTETVAPTVTETKAVTDTEPRTSADTSSQETQPGTFTSASSIPYDGLWSLPEMITRSDVIAVVELHGVDRGVEAWKPGDDVGYSKTLEFTFQVKEYLKGSGGDEVVGIVFDWTQTFDTVAGTDLAKDLDPDRKTDWDNRKAVVFLRDDAKDPQLNWEAGRYYLGLASEEFGEEYSVLNRYYRPWLPAASDSDDEQRFLLGSDQVLYPPTISLDELKARISAIEQDIEGRSDEYRDCVLANYRWQREVLYWKESLGGTYYYIREDVNVGSGMPQGAKVYTSPLAPVAIANESPVGENDEYVLAGRDPEYFTGAWPGEIFLDRPLPQGEYRAYHAHLPYHLTICGGTVPEDEMGRFELFVTVTAPAGTLHEAFFDPVEDGKAVLADNTVGVLEPATFSDANGASATIQRIAWEADAVKLTLSPHTGIAGHTVEFIALDGSVSLSLKVADAEVDETNGTLTWKVESQPWQSGDKMMLRISAPTK